MDATSQQELTVNGMTCGHCAQTLTAELGTLSGVTSVDVGEAGFELLAVHERTQ